MLEAAQIRAVVEGVVGLSSENKQKFADACGHFPAWHKNELSIMGAEIEKKTTRSYSEMGRESNTGKEQGRDQTRE